MANVNKNAMTLSKLASRVDTETRKQHKDAPAKKVWIGTHNGDKTNVCKTKGDRPVAKPDAKAMKRLACRQNQHANGVLGSGTDAYEKKTFKGRQKPGSQKKVC